MARSISVSQVSQVAQTDAVSDEVLLNRWLHGRGPHTTRAYRSDAIRFFAFVGRPLRAVTLDDVQAFADDLAAADLAASSRARTLAAVKSLLAFGHRVGYLRFDVGRALRLPSMRSRLAERILTEAEVQRLFALTRNRRDLVLLRLLYAAGLRVSEAASLRWRDAQLRDDAGQVTVLAKGDRTRAVLLPRGLWTDLLALRGSADEDGPVFRSRVGRPLSTAQIRRIVQRAANLAGLGKAVSPHWLRHAHASHALDRGAPISLVQATLGHADLKVTSRYTHARPSASSAQYLVV